MYDRNLTIYSISNAIISKSMKIYPFLTKVEKYNFEEDLQILLNEYEDISKHGVLKKESESDHQFLSIFRCEVSLLVGLSVRCLLSFVKLTLGKG